MRRAEIYQKVLHQKDPRAAKASAEGLVRKTWRETDRAIKQELSFKHINFNAFSLCSKIKQLQIELEANKR